MNCYSLTPIVIKFSRKRHLIVAAESGGFVIKRIENR